MKQFVKREYVLNLVPLMDYMRVNHWDAEIIVANLELNVPLFQLDDETVVNALRKSAVRVLKTRNSHSMILLLTNGLIADISHNRVRYYNPLYGDHAKHWEKRWKDVR